MPTTSIPPSTSLPSTILLWHQQNASSHASRVTTLARALAHALQLDDLTTHIITLAAYFHDIGKIAIPPSILNKPGPLTDDEWHIMRRHSSIGARILQRSGGLYTFTAPLVLAHHERWDGLGYPRKLSGPTIPLGARIIAIADSYVAMTETRPYRPARIPLEALTEIQRCSSTAYDPHIVSTFLHLQKHANENHLSPLQKLPAFIPLSPLAPRSSHLPLAHIP